MKMEKARADFERLISENGFEDSGDRWFETEPIYQREWSRPVTVAFYGECTETLTVRIAFDCVTPFVSISRNGRVGDIRCYTSPKRAMNAIREIARYAGFEM